MKDRSIFFPLALIAAGVLWILISMGRIPLENLWALAHFWPFLLIAAGVGLIMRSYWAPARMLMDVLVIGGAVSAILFAPQLGWATPQWGGWSSTSLDGGSIPGSGSIITQTREVQDFLAVSIAVPAEVTIQQGKAETVKITAEDNLLPQLSTEVVNGTLVIRNNVSSWNERVSASMPVRITITVKDINRLELSSAGNVRIEQLETANLNVIVSGAGDVKLIDLSVQNLEARISGAGDIRASGTASDLQLVISGVGSFDGSDLLGQSANASISGAGSATVHPAKELTAKISGTGSIDYYGSPVLTKSISGLGSVDKIGE